MVHFRIHAFPFTVGGGCEENLLVGIFLNSEDLVTTLCLCGFTPMFSVNIYFSRRELPSLYSIFNVWFGLVLKLSWGKNK